ncbi:MAG: hypothetical protein LC772_10530, partial [Chloroflexi bacterium]|nr:hypothetical protein [Chloroflexota bacterium]
MDELLERMVEEVTSGRVFERLPNETQTNIRALHSEEVREGARRGLTRPQPGDVSQAGRLLLNPCLAVQWLTVFEDLCLPRVLHVFEPCAGGSDPVLLAADIYAREGSYTTVNLNRRLAAELRSKTGKLHLDVNIIEDNAGSALSHLQPGSMDIACFHHAINDILQTAVSEPRGMDTRTIEWWS